MISDSDTNSTDPRGHTHNGWWLVAQVYPHMSVIVWMETGSNAELLPLLS